jgi:hypothetical protein
MPLPEGSDNWTQEQIEAFIEQHRKNIENANTESK